MSKDDRHTGTPWSAFSVAKEGDAPRFPGVNPGDLVIGTSPDRILVIIKPSGQLIYGPEYTPDEAAVTFWEEMGRRRLEMEERLLLIGHMEAILTRLGEQDLRTEHFRIRAQEELDPDRRSELQIAAENAMAKLNMIAHEAIELGRAMARRDLPLPEVPEQVPQSVQDDERSQYKGREGLPEEDMAEVPPNVPKKPGLN